MSCSTNGVSSSSNAAGRVGLLAIQIYYPPAYVRQTELEEYDGAPSGKYTIGLGQQSMSFCSDREDAISMALTVVTALMREYDVDYQSIGRLEVGTESLVDKSKSIKTHLMTLFASSGNHDVEGTDTYNACYGGTQALFNAINWLESSSCEGRLALVVTTDIARYPRGPARPTGGCGAVAMLLGPNAPLEFEQGLRAIHMDHVYDFYKPCVSPYPVVDGPLSIQCYMRAFDACYATYRSKFRRLHDMEFTEENAQAYVFHSPFNKIVQKSFGRLIYNDYLNGCHKHSEALKEFSHVGREESLSNRALEQAYVKASRVEYQQKVAPSTLLPRELGNLYTGSVFSGLASLIYNLDQTPLKEGDRVVVFSYGSGMAAAMFSMRLSDRGSSELEAMRANLRRAVERLEQRVRKSAKEFDEHMALLDEAHVAMHSDTRALTCSGHIDDASEVYVPRGSTSELFPGTFYLVRCDERRRRFYQST